MPLENITLKEIHAIKCALMGNDKSMTDYALRIIEHRERSQKKNDRRSLNAFAAECKKYGSD